MGNDCAFNTKIAPQNFHLSLPCLSRINGHYDPDGRQLELSFDKDGLFATLTWQAHEPIAVHLKRVPQDRTRSPLAGDWIAKGVSQTCVLHVYTRDYRNELLDALDPSGLTVSLDILDSEEGMSGWRIGGIDYRPQQDNFISFSLNGVRTEMFSGRIELQQGRIIGDWPGHSDCNVFVRSILE